MKTFASLAIVAAAALSVVAAQEESPEGRLYYTEPVGSTVWTAGKTATVAWKFACRDENTSDLDIVLYKGTGSNAGTEQIRVPGISAIGKLRCDKGAGTATVDLPATLETSDKYAIHVETEPYQSYSAAFTINGVAPANPGTGAPGTGAPGTGAPGTGAPGTGAPGTGAPGTGAPGTGAPGTGAPGTGAPGTGAPGTGAPGTGAPGTGAPGVGTPANATTTTKVPAVTAPAPVNSNTPSAGSSLKTLGSVAAVIAAAVGASLF